MVQHIGEPVGARAKMCGRYTLTCTPEVIAEEFQLQAVPDFDPCYNVAPSQWVACMRTGLSSRKRETVMLRWGLLPSWARDPAIGMKLINARAETVAEKPSFRKPFRERRCLCWRTAITNGNRKAHESSPTISG